MHYIFRKLDKVILYTPGTARQFENEWEACLRNEGGVAEDYVVVEAEGPPPPGMVPSLTPDNQVEFIPNPKIVAKEKARARLSTKFRALGLTDAEIRLLIRL